MTTLNRRTLLTSTGLVLAGSALTDVIQPANLLFGQSTEALNQTLLNTVRESIGTACGRIAAGTATTSDYATMAAQSQSLLNELVNKNSDVDFKVAASQATASNGQYTAAAIANSAYYAVQPYAPNYPFAKINAVISSLPQFNPSLPAATLEAIMTGTLGSLAHNGMTPWITQAYDIFEGFGNGGIDTPNSSGCAELNLAIVFMGAAFTTLAVMCAVPEPALVIICPATALAGIIFGVLCIIAALFC